MTSTDKLTTEFESVNVQLTQLREKILLLTHEESQLLIRRAHLEKELFPEEVAKKTAAILELLRQRRLGE